jgi:predicted branched-subunit amino acid permease
MPAASDSLLSAVRTSDRAIVRNAVGIGVATGAYGISFGAVSITAGRSVAQTAVLSLLMFTGASQYALVGVLGAGGGALPGVATAVLLGTRNALYGLRLASLLDVRGLRRAGAAQLIIDESTAMAVSRDRPREARLAFWATGLSVFVLWNLGTVAGALGARALSDPRVLGLDAAAPAAFIALLAPRMRSREPWLIALVAAGAAIVAVPLSPVGVPVLAAAAAAALLGVRTRRDVTERL